MKKILTVICCFAILATTAFAAVGCDLFGGSNVITAGDENSVYAVSMLSGVGMLGVMDENEKSDERRNEAQPPKTDKLSEGATVRPAEMSDEVVEGIKNSLVMFESAVSDGKIEQKIELNTDKEGEYGSYEYVMTVTAPMNHNITMYYNEINKREEVEIDDDGKEIEIKSDIKGVMIFNGNTYDIEGKHETETEDDEKSVELTVITRSRINIGNYIVIKYENEAERDESEVSYEYKIYENGSLMQKYEVEFENERGKTECKFKFEVGGSDGKTEYKLKQENDGEMRIEYKKANLKCKIKVNRTENGYRFVYNNGYVEEIPVSENI